MIYSTFGSWVASLLSLCPESVFKSFFMDDFYRDVVFPADGGFGKKTFFDC